MKLSMIFLLFDYSLAYYPPCFSFLKMAYELHGILSGAISLTTWEKVMPAYGGEPESFLHNVITPIYKVIKEVQY